jgi:Transposase IS116/IS110/IS902 family
MRRCDARITRTDQVVAYAGLDIEVKQSGKWKGQAKLSKRGSGRLRRILAPFSHPPHAPTCIRLWSLLSSVSRPGQEKARCHDGRDAQDADCRLSTAQDRGDV